MEFPNFLQKLSQISLSLTHTLLFQLLSFSLYLSPTLTHTHTHTHTLFSLFLFLSLSILSFSFSHCLFSLSDKWCLSITFSPSFVVSCLSLYFYFLSNVISLSVFSLTYILVSCLSQISCISIFYLMSCPNPSILCPPIAYLVSRFTLSSVSVYFNVSGTRTHDLSYERHKPYHTALLLSQSNLVIATSIFWF